MKIDKYHIILFIISIVLLLMLSFCDKKNDSNFTETSTTDTVYTTKYISNTKYDTIIKHKIIKNDVTDTITETVFKDTNYTLQVFSDCPTDSIKLDFKYPTIITTNIKQSKQLKNEFGILYQYDKDNSLNLMYGRNFNIITPFVTAGLNINKKTPIVGVGIKINF